MARGGTGALGRPFAALLTGTVASRLGTELSGIALAWLVMQLTGSTLAMGSVAAAADIPAIALLMLGGVMADRVSRTWLLMRVGTAQALVGAVLAALVAAHAVNFAGLLVLSAAAGGLSALYGPTLGALKMSLLPREPAGQYQKALALWQGVSETASLLGPLAGGVVVAVAGVATAFWVDAVSFLGPAWAGWVLARARVAAPPPAAAPARAAWRASLAEGIGFLRGEPGMLAMIGLFGLTNGLNDVLVVLAPFRIRSGLHQSAAVYGLILAAAGLGAVAAAAAWTRWGAQVRQRMLWICGGVASLGAAIFALALVSSPVELALAMAVGGAGFITAEILSQALWAHVVPDAVRGRVMSVASTIAMSANPLGYMLAGVLGALVGPAHGLMIGGAAMVAACAGGYALAPLRALSMRIPTAKGRGAMAQ